MVYKEPYIRMNKTLLIWLLVSGWYFLAVIPNRPDKSDSDYENLRSEIDASWNNDSKALELTRRFVSMARTESNHARLAEGYNLLMHKEGIENRLIYADSAIFAALRTNNDRIIGSAYLSRGIANYEEKKRDAALTDFVTANRYVIKTGDEYLINKIKYQIAQTKYYLGYYNEALALFRQCVSYFADENERAYLNSLHGLSLSAQAIGQHAEATASINIGLSLTREYDIPQMVPYFLQSEGTNQVALRNFPQAESLLTQALKSFETLGDIPSQCVTKYYLGICNWETGKKKQALDFFESVHDTFMTDGYIRPDLRHAYTYLLQDAKMRNDVKSQLAYSSTLRKADSVLHSNFRYLMGKTSKEYDTANLLDEKAIREAQLKKNIYTTLGISASLALGFFVVVRLQNRKLKRYKANYDALIAKPSTTTTQPKVARLKPDTGLMPEVEATLLKNLEKFEANQKYLEKDMSLTRMATLLNTNTKYVTRIIAAYRGKKTIEYITDLKIDYIVSCLQNDRRFRLYTNSALACEAGFGSTQIFTKSFKQRLGFSPTFYIGQLTKEEIVA